MTTETAPSYTELADHYRATIDIRERVERRMHECVPGSTEGHGWYAVLERAESAEFTARKLMRAHPDAPPQG